MRDELKIGATLWELGRETTAQSLATQAVIAEDLGYHSFWFSESHFSGPASIPSPLMYLAAVASSTDTIKLASTSYLLPIRHPLQAAEEVAVLDNLSNGRVILGVGRGFRDALFDAFNIPRSAKRKLFAGTLNTMIQAWRGEALESPGSDNGEIYLGPLPVQKPHPPIWVAAFGPLAIKQAAKLGLPYLASPMESLAQLEKNYRRHSEIAAGLGMPQVEITPVMRTLFVSRDERQVTRVREQLAAEANTRDTISGIQAGIDEWAIIGTPAEVQEKIATYRETLGMTHLVVRGRIPGLSSEDHIASLELLGTMKL